MTSRLVQDLAAYMPEDEYESVHRDMVSGLVRTGRDAFFRTHFAPGHITGSALLVSADGARVLMNYHRTLDKWLCFGGHADGETDIMNVARRETAEESGISGVEPLIEGIFDIDVHDIPANENRKEPPHRHYDIRYLFRVTGSEDFTISDESAALRWCTADEAMALVPGHKGSGMRRMLEKWRKIVKD